jgi:hypothetical protein
MESAHCQGGSTHSSFAFCGVLWGKMAHLIDLKGLDPCFLQSIHLEVSTRAVAMRRLVLILMVVRRQKLWDQPDVLGRESIDSSMSLDRVA